jgi:hypothetical protein
MGIADLLAKKSIERFESQGYKVTKRIGSILIDEENKKWAVCNSKNGIHNFSDISSVEIKENGQKYKSQHGIIRAVVGGAVFGAVGALAGAGSAHRAQTISHLSVDIYLKDFDCPLETVPLISSATKTDSFLYKSAYENIQKMAATLTIMQNMA